MRIHLDTDLGGDPDDACALLLLLGWPGIELAGVTTVLDGGGLRAGAAEHYLSLAGRVGADVVVAAGATATLGGDRFEPTVGDPALWPTPVTARPGALDVALDLLAGSLAAGATVVAIGPLTNLARLERRSPGALDGARLVVMGGWTPDGTARQGSSGVGPSAAGALGEGWPAWGPERDWNWQVDVEAVEVVLGSRAELVLVPIPASIPVQLTARDLPALRAAGPAGALAARQSTAYARARGYADLASAHPRLPDDLVNFHWDPVAAAVASGWDDVAVERWPVAWERRDGVLHLVLDVGGRPVDVVTAVDAAAFREVFLHAVGRLAPG